MTRYLFSSHDGFGLGHVRRNTLVARALLAREPDAEIVIVTGTAVKPAWLGHDRMRIVSVPPLLKDTDGAYANSSMTFDDAIRARARRFNETIVEIGPDVVVVDRHPYGIAGELRPGLERAARAGSALVLGLRDVLDEPAAVRAELAGDGWAGVGDLFDQVLVYGEPTLCDHVSEYGLEMRPTYCGWVVEQPAPVVRDERLVVVAAGGGGDGDDVYRLGVELATMLPGIDVVVVAGPYASSPAGLEHLAPGRLRVLADVPSCAALVARAGAVVQMAGYNSTVEALAAGIRPVLVPRRSPRREQAIRAGRLAALGLADVVDEGAPAGEVAWLLRQDRRLPPGAVEAAGIRLDGAARAAAAIVGATVGAVS